MLTGWMARALRAPRAPARLARRRVSWGRPVPSRPALRSAILSGAAAAVTSVAAAGPLIPPSALDSVVVVDVDRGAAPGGSGVVIGQGGLIVTALAVIGETGAVEIRLADGRSAPARRLGHDPISGVALLQTEASAPALSPGPKPALAAPACALGASFGGGVAASCGVISAHGVSGLGALALEDLLQTDVAAHPGTLGGALLDRQGRLLGMIAAIRSAPPGRGSARAAAGASAAFATPAPLLLRVAEALAAGEPVSYVDPGWRLAPLGPRLSADLAGALIAETHPGGLADRVGFKRNDVLLAVAGRPLRGPSDAAAALAIVDPGAMFEIAFLRDGRRQTKTLRAPGARPRDARISRRVPAPRQEAAATDPFQERVVQEPARSEAGAAPAKGAEEEGSFWDFFIP